MVTNKKQSTLHTCHDQGFHTFCSALHCRFHQCCESKCIPLLNIKPGKIVQQIVCNGYMPFKETKKQTKYVTECRCCLKGKPEIYSCRSDNWKMQIIKISFLCVLFHSLQSSALELSGPDLWPKCWYRRWKTWVPTFSRVALLSESQFKARE